MVCRQVYNSICGLQMSTTVFVVFNSVYGLQASLQQYLWSSGQSTTVSVVCRQVYNRVCGKVTPKAGSAGKSRDKRPVQSQQVSAKPTSTVSQRTENYDKSDFQNFDLQLPSPPMVTHRGYEYEAC